MALVLVVGLTATAGAQADRIEHAQRRVAAAPNDPALWVKLADALVRAQRISEGIDAYQSAIKLDPSAAEPKLALARVQLQIGEPMRAALLMRDVVATSTDDALVASTGNELVALEEM
ncbi:MAG TPA: tetratricopeptide repeat protein, partial [Kofleriaceae bacterium]